MGIAANSQRAVERVREIRKALDRAERHIKDGKFRTALTELDDAQVKMKGARALTERALDGMIDAHRPTG